MGEARGKASTGLKPNVAGLLCYLLFWVTGLEFLFVEKKDKFIRFHAIQSIIVFGFISAAFLLLFWIPVIGWVFSYILGALSFVLWILLMIRAYRGDKIKMPIAGKIAAKNA
ncbi:MAG: hypothetical protein PVJ08_09070 [Dehalococcoidia bacterium]|jgi:uncharacterized membrane protein